MPATRAQLLPGHDGTDGPRGPDIAGVLPWIALTAALTAIACTWLGRASLPFMLAIAAWAGIALARQRTERAGPAMPVPPPHGPLFRIVSGAGPTETPSERPAPALRLVVRNPIVAG